MDNTESYYEDAVLDSRGFIDDSGPARGSFRWFSRPVIAVLLILPVLMVFKAQAYIAIVLLAYLNCIIGAWAVIAFAKKGRVDSLIPVIFLPLLIIGWPLASIYFAMFFPEISYGLGFRAVSHLSGNERIQFAVLLFLLGYLPLTFFSLRKSTEVEGGRILYPSKIIGITTFLGMTVLSLHAISRVAPFPGFLEYLINGLLKYTFGVFFVSGALLTYMSKRMKILLGIFFPCVVFFYTLGNARMWAMMPALLFIFGVLFASKISPRTKLIILVSLVLLVPMYVVVGNATRVLTGSIGFENLGYRFEALKDWRQAVQQTTPLRSFLGRLFFTAGHTIVTETPEYYPYRSFGFIAYFKEFFLMLLPGRIYYNPYYSGSLALRNYGFMIIPGQTSVEVSLLGNFWLIGGPWFVFMGGVFTAALQYLLIKVIRRAWRRSQFKALLYVGLISNLLIGACGQDIMSNWRNIVWQLIFGFVYYIFIGFIAGEFSRPAEYQYQQEDYA
ncbi:MAG: hypothetical protein ACYTE8_01755 [Planctomycetota bacterium]|jgi:hypothetical protein